MADEMLAEQSHGNSSVLGHKQRLAAPAAALCNGTAIHGFELDDITEELVGHPGAIVIPAALAVAESVNATGPRLLLGILAGYEAMYRIGKAVGLHPTKQGFHKTAVFGPVAAAIGAGVVMNLTREQLSSAVGLACATSSGIKSFSVGTGGGMMKRMHAGRAAEAGARMSQLAARDFTAPPTALDGRFGLLEVFSAGTAQPERLVSELGKHWAIEHMFVKVFSCCGWVQSSIQALLDLRGPRPLAAELIRKVRIGVPGYVTRNNGAVTPPDTMGAQYSLPYCSALALAGDPRDPTMFEEAAINDPARRALAQRVELVTDPELDAAFPRHSGARVELELANGERRNAFVPDPHGSPADPCTDAEIAEKFTRLASFVKSAESAEKLARTIRRMESLSSVREITALL